MHGFEVPRYYKDALRIDAANSNTRWQGVIDLELDQIKAYGVFKDLGDAVWKGGKLQSPPEGHQE